MATTREEISQLNFGYLNGFDLLQFAPAQVLTAQYDKYPEMFTTGCNMAYDEIQGELITRYDISKELSNSNQLLKSKTGDFTATFLAKSYISRIIVNWDYSAFISINAQYSGVSPTIKIGTSLNGEDIIALCSTDYQKVFWINKFYNAETTYYFSVTGGSVNVDIACDQISNNINQISNIYSPKPKNGLLLKIVAILALRNILGSLASDNKVLQGHFEWYETTVLKIKSRQMSMTLDSAPQTIASRAYSVKSSFKTLD